MMFSLTLAWGERVAGSIAIGYTVSMQYNVVPMSGNVISTLLKYSTSTTMVTLCIQALRVNTVIFLLTHKLMWI